MSTREDITKESLAWHNRTNTHGMRIADTLDEIKQFAFKTFSELDKDGNGFISRAELQEALLDNSMDWRERSYISFLLRRIEDISEAYQEEWETNGEGISRVDIQEYFKKLKSS